MKKIKKFIIFSLLIALTAVCLTLSGCEQEGEDLETQMRWKTKGGTYIVDLTNAGNPVAITREKFTFHPFDGFGFVINADGNMYQPSQGKASVLSSKKVNGRVEMDCSYSVGENGTTIPYHLSFWLEENRLFLHVRSEDNRIRRIHPGISRDFGPWKQKDITRYGEFYDSQDWYSQPVYHLDGKFFVFSDWLHTQGNGTDYSRFAMDENGNEQLRMNAPMEGSDPKEMTTTVVYAANLKGKYMTVEDTLYISVSDSLWDVIPQPTEKSTVYKNELKDKVYFDAWVGSISNAWNLLHQMDMMSGQRAKFLTIFQDWGAEGWDQTLPDNYNVEKGLYPRGGSLEEIGEFVEYAKSFGFAGLRTNYVWATDKSPAMKEGVIERARGADGAKAWFVKPEHWLLVPQRQETDIRKDFAPNCNFSDQMGSGSMTPAYVDYESDDTSLRNAIEKQRGLINLIKEINPGPFGSESSAADFLMGDWYDYGEYGIYGGHHRKVLLPDYKLKRLHQYAMMYGMGIPYRWFELPPFPKFQNDQSFPYTKAYIDGMDDYRACTILYGNGAYIGYLPNTPYEYMLTEVMVVGQIQKYYAFEEVKDVYYLHKNQWVTLNKLFVLEDVTEDSYTRIKVVYKNGLEVYVNRSEEELQVKTFKGQITLPRYGWVISKAKEKVIAYSAFYPGTTKRIDCFEDKDIRFINPRGALIDGVDKITLWEKGKIVMQYENRDEYTASRDFSGVQGKDMWYYETYDSTIRKYNPMNQFDEARSYWSSGDVIIGPNWQQAGKSIASVRKWIAPYNGMTTISGTIKVEGSKETEVRVTRNGELLESYEVNDIKELNVKVRCNARAGDQVRIEVHGSDNAAGIKVLFDPLIKYYR